MIFEQAMDLAIGREQAAADFYLRAAERTRMPGLREIFQEVAREEKAHRAKLEFIKSTGEIKAVSAQPMDIKPGEYPADVLPFTDLDDRNALKWAMKKEKAAFRYFSAFAAVAPNDALRAAFSTLAFEEANHKLRFEIACDDLDESEPKSRPWGCAP